MRTYPSFLFSSFLFFSLLAKAQSEDSQAFVFTRSQAIDYVLAHNLDLAAARMKISQAQARYSGAGMLENPVLNLEVASDYGQTDEGQYDYAIGFEQQFPVTNRLQLSEDIAAIEIKLAEAEIRDQERRLALDLDKLMVHLVALRDQILIRRELIALNERLASFLRSRIKTGEASPIDVNQLKVTLYAIEQEIQKLNIRREDLLASIKMLMGLPLNAEVVIHAELALPEKAPGLLEVTQASLELHPEYQLKELLSQIWSKRTDLAIAERWADIAIKVFFEQDRGFDEPVGLKDDRFIGLGFSIPLPFRNQNRGRIEASRARRRQMDHELEAATLAIRSRSIALANRVQRLYQQAVDYNRNVTRLAEQNMVDMSAAYSKGQVDLATLFRAQEQALAMQSSHVDLLRDYELALVEWQGATAGMLPHLALKGEDPDEK